MGQHADRNPTTATEAEEARAWLRVKGFDVVVVERDRRDELMQAGFAGLASENRIFWADLVSTKDPTHVFAPNYGSGKSAEEAVVRARRRFGSEQT
jgi:hypothetical protein